MEEKMYKEPTLEEMIQLMPEFEAEVRMLYAMSPEEQETEIAQAELLYDLLQESKSQRNGETKTILFPKGILNL